LIVILFEKVVQGNLYQVCWIKWSPCTCVNKILKRTTNWIYLFQAWYMQFVCFNLREVLGYVLACGSAAVRKVDLYWESPDLLSFSTPRSISLLTMPFLVFGCLGIHH